MRAYINIDVQLGMDSTSITESIDTYGQDQNARKKVEKVVERMLDHIFEDEDEKSSDKYNS